ncbi:MAG: transglycosylase SLT domain-containing protein [Bacteroidales bacterium]|nr:transglycosylase SLT domain-containing protein [Bacteroidales bacterium]
MKTFENRTKMLMLIICFFLNTLSLNSNNITVSSDSIKNNKAYFLRFLDSLSSISAFKFQDNSIRQLNIKNTENAVRKKINDIKLKSGLSYNSSIIYFIDYYANNKNIQNCLSLSVYYFPIIEKKLSEQRLPDELKYLAMAASSFYPLAINEKGDGGCWQLSFSIARHYGLKIDSYIDQRYDFQKSSDAAISYLVDLYSIYKNWQLSIAAFNCGAANVNKAIRRAKGSLDFWDIYDYLPSDSRDYIPAMLALIYIDYTRKELNINKGDLNANFKLDTVYTYKQMHFKQISTVLNISYNYLKELNPVYKKNIIPESSRGSVVFLPAGIKKRFYELSDTIVNYKDSSIVDLKTVYNFIKEPVEAVNKPIKTELYYIVKSGDNLSKIAHKYSVSITDLKKWNRLKSNSIRIGQKLLVKIKTY